VEIARLAIVYMPALWLSICVHAFAQAWVATRLGDPTPEREGRLTLSPLVQGDLFGSLVFPLFALVSMAAIGHPGGGILGWGKPVRFESHLFSRKVSARAGAAIAAMSGPVSNLLLALASAVALRFMLRGTLVTDVNLGGLAAFLAALLQINILLGVFQCLPLPPLDGAHLLPRSMDDVRAWLERNAFILFIVLFMLPFPGIGRVGWLILSPLVSLVSIPLFAIAQGA
jgi:Zn-dependent protease